MPATMVHCIFNAYIVAPGEAFICFAANMRDLGKFHTQALTRIIARPVIDDNNFDILIGNVAERLQAQRSMPIRIEMNEDDADPWL
jgi:hypothetical protein